MCDRVLRNEAIRSGNPADPSSIAQLWPRLYDDLHTIASRHMRSEGPGGLLQTTAIVHEAFLRLADRSDGQWPDKQGFFAAVVVVMRRVLVDHARKEKSRKRGGDAKRQLLSESRLSVNDQGYSILEIHDALKRLAEFAPDQAKAMELMIFGGMTVDEVAETLNLSPSTIDRRLRSARAWLRRELSGDG